MRIDPSFAEFMYSLLNKKFSNQSKMADAIGIDKRDLSDFLTGKRVPKLHVMEMIKSRLKLTDAEKRKLDKALIQSILTKELNPGHNFVTIDRDVWSIKKNQIAHLILDLVRTKSEITQVEERIIEAALHGIMTIKD